MFNNASINSFYLLILYKMLAVFEYILLSDSLNNYFFFLDLDFAAFLISVIFLSMSFGASIPEEYLIMIPENKTDKAAKIS